MLVEVVSGNMGLLVEEVGRLESGEEGEGGRGGGGGGRGGEEGEMGETGDTRGGDEGETSQLALDVVEQLLVRIQWNAKLVAK